MKYFIIFAFLVFLPLVESESFAQIVCKGSPAADKYTGRKKVRKWDNCQGIQFYRIHENKTKIRLKYDGFFVKGKKTGQGSQEILSPSEFSGQKYTGEFKDGNKHGQGTLTLATGEKYVGEFKNDNLHGQGKFTLLNGGYFKGYFENDNFINGYADITNDDGSSYVGEFKDGNKHGQGKFTFLNGEYFKGYFENDNFINGFVDITIDDGTNYVGEFKDGNKHGQGTLTLATGEKYVGEFKDGNKHGQGKITFANGCVQEGFWKNDQFQYAHFTIGSKPEIDRKEPDSIKEIMATISRFTQFTKETIVEIMVTISTIIQYSLGIISFLFLVIFLLSGPEADARFRTGFKDNADGEGGCIVFVITIVAGGLCYAMIEWEDKLRQVYDTIGYIVAVAITCVPVVVLLLLLYVMWGYLRKRGERPRGW